MSISAVKGVMRLAVVIAVAMSMAAMLPRFNRYSSLALFLGACALIVVTLLWYRRVMPAAEAREEERQAQQLLTLKQQLSFGEPVVVKARGGGVVFVLVAALFVLCGYVVFTDPDAGFGGTFVGLGVVTAMLALIFGPQVGRPTLTVRPDGIEMPIYGFLRWSEIESVGLRTYHARGVTTHSIDLYVPDLSERESRLNPLLRASRLMLARRSPNFIGIHLVLSTLPATLVYQLCYGVWKQRTGKARAWTASLSEQQIADMRRTEQQFDRLQRSPSDPAATRKLLEQRANAYARNMGTTLAIVAVMLAALVVTALALLGE